MDNVYVGQTVKIKHTAFDDHSDESMFHLRGETGKVRTINSDATVLVNLTNGVLCITIDDLEDADDWQL